MWVDELSTNCKHNYCPIRHSLDGKPRRRRRLYLFTDNRAATEIVEILCQMRNKKMKLKRRKDEKRNALIKRTAATATQFQTRNWCAENEKCCECGICDWRWRHSKWIFTRKNKTKNHKISISWANCLICVKFHGFCFCFRLGFSVQQQEIYIYGKMEMLNDAMQSWIYIFWSYPKQLTIAQPPQLLLNTNVTYRSTKRYFSSA